MKFSLKTKFYVYILPLLIVLPILLYSLIEPYTQLREGFGQFKVDANRATEAQQLGVSLATEHLELFHFLAAAPNVSYDLATNPNYPELIKTIKTVDDQMQNLQTEITQSVEAGDLEKELVDRLSSAHNQYQTLTKQVLDLSSTGQKAEAYGILGGDVAVFMASELQPEVEKLELIKEDDVKTGLPNLTQNLTKNGMFPIPGLQDRINLVLNNFENSVDTVNLDQLIDAQQASVFFQVTQQTATESASISHQSQLIDNLETRSEIGNIFASLRTHLSPQTDSSELALIDQLDLSYQKLLSLDNQALNSASDGKQDQALLLLSGEVDNFEINTIDPQLQKLILNNKQNIQNQINDLSHELDLITFAMYLFVAVVFLIGLAGLWKLSQDIITPIITLRNATVKLASGDFNARVEVLSKDEIGQLAKNFNDMAQNLQNSYSNLEERVRIQTLQLSGKLGELEQNKKGMLNILEDLNLEKSRLLQKETELTEAQQAGKFGSFVWNLETNEITWSKEMYTLLNISETAASPTIEQFGQLVYAEDRDKLAQGIKDVMATAKPFENEIRIQYADKSIHWMKARGKTVFKNGKPNQMVGTMQDATAEKQLENLKDEFVSIASHELRTPMTAIKGFITMIEEGDYGSYDKGLNEPLSDILSSVERLIYLVNDMLNVSRIESGRMKFNISVFDIKPIIEEIVGSLQPITKTKKITLTAGNNISSMVSADSDKVKQILNNLIGNSLKFTDQGGITVSAKQDGQLLKIYVTDTGMGIDPKDQTKLFAKFQQINSQQAGKPAGTGLGLYLSRQLCNKMGGDMWIERSELGRGSVFAFSIPILQSALALKIKSELESEGQFHPDQKSD